MSSILVQYFEEREQWERKHNCRYIEGMISKATGNRCCRQHDIIKVAVTEDVNKMHGEIRTMHPQTTTTTTTTIHWSSCNGGATM